MKTEQQYFESALSMKDYMDQMTTHKENSEKVYREFEMPADDAFIELLKEKKPHVLGITEDWCGDAMMNNPILRRIAEVSGIDVHVVFRDQNLELMDRYLTNGGRSIPKYIFLSQEGEVIGTWGPRAPKLQEYVMELKKDIPSKDDPQFEAKQKQFIDRVNSEYTSNQQYWQWVYEDIRHTLTNALQK